jgi:hypothetical protein
VNNKRLQLTTVYFLTLNGHLALFLILTSDIDIQLSIPWTRPQRATRVFTIVEPVKYWVIISLFRFFEFFFIILVSIQKKERCNNRLRGMIL